MSSGQKAAYEDEQEKRRFARERKLKAMDPYKTLTAIDEARDSIARLIASEPAMTQRQHAWLGRAAEHLEKLP
jgi:hypothetical protein